MDQSFHIRPFAFDRVFTMASAATIDPGLQIDELRAQLAMLEAENRRLRDERELELATARAEAFAAGLDQARSEQEAALLTAVDALGAQLEAMDTAIEDISTAAVRDAADLAIAAGEHLAARALEESPGAAIDLAIGRVLKQVMRGTELTVRVHPDLVGEIERLIAIRQAGDRRRLNLHVAADAGLAIGDARIEWDQGGLVLDAEARRAAVRAELEQLPVPR